VLFFSVLDLFLNIFNGRNTFVKMLEFNKGSGFKTSISIQISESLKKSQKSNLI
jgi:hypothetical protein